MARTALSFGRSDMFLVPPEELTLIEDPKHALYDDRVLLPLDEPLVQSIMRHGVKRTLICCKDGDRVVVLDGQQRTKAAREANRRLAAEGKEPVRCKIVLERGSDGDLYGVKLLANAMAQEETPMGRAVKIQKYLSLGRTEAEAAVVLGLKTPQVKALLSLLDLSPKVQQAVEKGEVNLTSAAKIAKLPRESQPQALADLSANVKEGKRPTVQATRNKVKEMRGEKGETPPGRKEIKRVLSVAGPAALGEDARAALLWVLSGEAAEGSIVGAVKAAKTLPKGHEKREVQAELDFVSRPQ